MRFYTNVQMVGDNFLVRGYEDGKHFMTREKFYPTLFVPSKRKTKYKTLEGEFVESHYLLNSLYLAITSSVGSAMVRILSDLIISSF